MVAGNLVETLLNSWQSFGLDYILAFLLVFALVFGILSKVNLFKDNKAVNLIISLVLALMSLKFGFFITLLSELTPRFAIALLLILAFAIAMLAFVPDDDGKSQKKVMTGLYIAGGVFTLIAVISAFNDPKINWFSSTWWQSYVGLFVGALIIIGIIAAIAASGPKKT